MTALLSNGFFLLFVKVYGAFLILGPVLLRIQFRFKAKINPQLVPVESLPPDVKQFMAPRAQSCICWEALVGTARTLNFGRCRWCRVSCVVGMTVGTATSPP